MKNLNLTRWLIFLLVPVFFAACSEDEKPPEPIVPNPDGFYVYGEKTVSLSITDKDAKMALALLNPGKSGGDINRDSIYGKIMYMEANASIQFASALNDITMYYGAVDGGLVESGTVMGNTDITDNMIHGSLVVDAGKIAIAEEGMYYVYADLKTLQFRIMKINAQMIGDATDLEWAAGTSLPQIFVSEDSVVFEGTLINLVGASGYKYRFGNGWEVFNNGQMATYTNIGVESYGTAWETGINDIGYFNDNIPHKVDGIFTVRLSYDYDKAIWKETKTKTGALLIDYTHTSMGLFGNAYKLPSGDTANWGSGTDGYGLKTPVKTGTVYTWTWNNTYLIEGREFIFLENGAWGGLQLDWSMFTSVNGAAVEGGKIVDATTTGGEWHNFKVMEAGNYNLSLVIDAAAETKTATIVASTK